jgi:hypothetical protein
VAPLFFSPSRFFFLLELCRTLPGALNYVLCVFGFWNQGWCRSRVQVYQRNLTKVSGITMIFQ